MKQTKEWSSFCIKAAFFIFLTLSTVAIGQAQTVTFAQFIERNGTQDFAATNNGTSVTFQSVAAGSPILFLYSNVAGLPPVLQGTQEAHIIITASTTSPAIQVGGIDPPRNIQRFSDTFTIQIIRDTPAGVGTGTQRNLLTAIVTPQGTSQASLSGDDLSDSAAFTASEARQNIVFTSDFLGFFPASLENLSLSFSSLNPAFSINPNGFINSFTAAGSGTFASTLAPIFNPPTAAGVSISGRVMSGYNRPVSRAIVTLTDQNGESRTATTNSLGYYRFENIPAGQVVTLNVTAKGWTYEPRVFNLNESVSDVDFHPIQ